MDSGILTVLVVFVPMIGAFIIPFASLVSLKFRNALAFISIFSSFLFSLALMPAVLAGNIVTASLQFPLGFNLVLTADALAVFMALVSSFISTIIIIYSFDYISHYDEQNEYYLMVVLFLAAMMGLVFSGNLIFLYLFWEITAITSWRLIGFFREKNHVLKADKSFLVTVFGALVMLIGFIMIYQQTGSFDLAAMKGVHIPNIVMILVLFGILSKSATFPFHTWLPDAGVAPSPVTALLHAAVLVKIGVYVFARLFVSTFGYGYILHVLVLLTAAVSALVAGGAALIDTDMKRIIAFSTVSQIAFIFLGLAVGNEIGVAGALLYILMHGLAKGGLFLCAGIVEQNTKTKDITKMGGLINTMPLTATAFIFCALSIMGIPPFGGFFCKYMVISSAVSGGQLFIAFTFIIAAVLTILYLFRIFNLIFLGESHGSAAKEGSYTMVACVLLLGFLSLLGGIFIAYPSQFAQFAARQMMGI